MDSHLDPYVSLDADRRLVTAFWASLIISANQQASQGALLDQQRRYVLDRATWAVTEITPAVTTKYFRQRFWSRNALAWAKQPSATKSSSGKALRHEHVVERRDLITALTSASTMAQAAAILDRAVACVVTKQEADVLDAVTGVGWTRYRTANLVVFDRHTRKLHPLP